MAEPAGRFPEEHPELHEHTDASARAIVTVAIGIGVVAILIHIFLAWLFFHYERQAQSRDLAQQRSGIEAAPPPVPPPQLQGVPGLHPNTPQQDLLEMQQQQSGRLNSYGPSDQPGYSRIPVSRAMALLLERGMPTATSRPATQPATRPAAP